MRAGAARDKTRSKNDEKTQKWPFFDPQKKVIYRFFDFFGIFRGELTLTLSGTLRGPNWPRVHTKIGNFCRKMRFSGLWFQKKSKNGRFCSKTLVFRTLTPPKIGKNEKNQKIKIHSAVTTPSTI